MHDTTNLLDNHRAHNWQARRSEVHEMSRKFSVPSHLQAMGARLLLILVLVTSRFIVARGLGGLVAAANGAERLAPKKTATINGGWGLKEMGRPWFGKLTHTPGTSATAATVDQSLIVAYVWGSTL
jgi:hypothetical protein